MCILAADIYYNEFYIATSRSSDTTQEKSEIRSHLLQCLIKIGCLTHFTDGLIKLFKCLMILIIYLKLPSKCNGTDWWMNVTWFWALFTTYCITSFILSYFYFFRTSVSYCFAVILILEILTNGPCNKYCVSPTDWFRTVFWVCNKALLELQNLGYKAGRHSASK